VINIKDFAGVCGRHLRESGKLRWNRVGYYLYLECALPQPPNKTHTLTLRDAGGRRRAAQPAKASASYTLSITGDLLDNC